MLRKLLFIALVILFAVRDADGCSKEKPQLLSPVDDAEDVQSPIVFEWRVVEGAEGYRVSIVEKDFDIDVIAETSRTTTTGRLAPGTWGWFVEAFFEDCESTVSDIYVFEVARAAVCPASVPILLTPSPGAKVTSPVTFSWTPVPGAIAYEVSASLDDGGPAFIGETSGTTFTADLGEGRLTWMIEAEFNGCDDAVSKSSGFEIPADPSCASDAPSTIAPAFAATNVPTQVDFLWTPVAGAKSYRVLILTDDNDDVRVLATTTQTRLRASVPKGLVHWAVDAELERCAPRRSAISVFETASPACTAPAAPKIQVEPQARSGGAYRVIWSASPNTALHELQEATSEDFSDAVTRPVNDVLFDVSRHVAKTTRYFYRVRSLSSCGRGASAYSDAASIVVTSADADAEFAASFGEQSPVVQRVFVPGSHAPFRFSARTDQPWLAVSPSSGTIPPEGMELTVTARAQELSAGTSTATIVLTENNSGRRRASAHATSLSIPVSVSLVTPVSPNSGNTPLPSSLIIPAVAHVEGIGARFESDVRIANTSAQVMKYLLNFTRSGTNGTKNGQQTTIQVAPGETAALDDILKNFFGFAAAGDHGSGVLEVRPLPTTTTGVPASPLVTFASSRTYALTDAGTFGQFVPAIPFSKFIGRGGVLSLQQIAQSPESRTNIGLVEAAGEQASVLLSVFGDDGHLLGSYPIELAPGEHTQLNSFLQEKGLTTQNGRIEVSVTSGTGKVTAYASVLDNDTGDPMFVNPVDLSKMRAGSVVIPGIAERSDIRLFNAGTKDAEVMLTLIEQGASAGIGKVAAVKPGEVLRIDDVLPSFFGSLIVTTDDIAKVIATARTYKRTSSGTFGQLVPGFSVAEGAGLGDRALQILQVEESDRFRTDLGIVELTGNAATVEITVAIPDSKIAAHVQLSLQPNEFRHIGGVLRQIGLSTTYNARITLKVISGSGRVSGYASLVDLRTLDPTLVPAQ